MFSTVLVANRGEIAVRVIRTLQRLGVHAVAVHSDADARAPHVLLADEAVRIGPAPAAESYLDSDAVLDAARATGAQAIHPGYGFLSENAVFARACAEAGIAFIGPPAEAMEALGDKVRAKQAAQEAGVPVLPGLQRPGLTDEEILAFAGSADDVLPLMVKAAAGGGGRGMRVVEALDALPEALGAARREAAAGFGDDTLLVERYVPRSRHVEVQLLADAHGNVVHLGERECSLQRRHQKVVEESPSPVVTPEVREAMGSAAVALAQAAGYVGAGTCEFLVPYDDPSSFFFLEVNARLQVEHPVTELVCGLDLVEQQLRVAAGLPLTFTQDEVVLRGHAIEVRVCAEDAASGFLPATGTVGAYAEPDGPAVRTDSGIGAGSVVGANYDSLLAKVIAFADDRESATDVLVRALDEVRILGVTTNTGFLRRLVDHPAVRAGDMDTGAIGRGLVPVEPAADERRAALVAAAMVEVLSLADQGSDPWVTLLGFRLDGPAPIPVPLLERGAAEPVLVAVQGSDPWVTHLDGEQLAVRAERLDGQRVALTIDGRRRVWHHADVDGLRWVGAGADAFAFEVVEPAVEGGHGAVGGALEAPMPGTVLDVRTQEGDEVQEGDVLVVIESMKMELSLTAPKDATVSAVHVGKGDSVKQGQALVELA